MEEIIYRDWIFDALPDVTRAIYTQCKEGGAESCCLPCKNYARQRDTVFPDGVKAFFDTAGIDYHKEVEVVHYGKVVAGKEHYYTGWLHFIGKILAGPDVKRKEDKISRSFEYVSVTENFSIGFREEKDLAFQNFSGHPLVQCEFEICLPWMIEAPEPPD